MRGKCQNCSSMRNAKLWNLKRKFTCFKLLGIKVVLRIAKQYQSFFPLQSTSLWEFTCPSKTSAPFTLTSLYDNYLTLFGNYFFCPAIPGPPGCCDQVKVRITSGSFQAQIYLGPLERGIHHFGIGWL